MLEIQKKLPECHYIGKGLKYPQISRKIMKNAIGGACASRAVTVGDGEIFRRDFQITSGRFWYI